MKKFYSLIFATLLAGSAMAAQEIQLPLNLNSNLTLQGLDSSVKKMRVENRNISSLAEMELPSLVFTGARKVDADASIEGNWEFTWGDYYGPESEGTSINVLFEASIGPDYIYFNDPTMYYFPMVATFDDATSTISFPLVLLGNDGTYDIYQAPFVWSHSSKNFVDMESLDGIYNASSGTITFQPDQGLKADAYTKSPFGSTLAGYFYAFDFEGAKKTGSSDEPGSDEDWIDLGNAIFMDGWVLPMFGENQKDESNWYEVPVQQNKSDKNLYRLVNPYKYGPVASVNQATGGGYIVFDVTDPEHVVFNKANAGFSYPQAGVTSFYCYNMLGMYIASNPGYTAQEIIDIVGDAIPYTKFENGVVSLSSVMTSNGIVYDANFGYQAQPNGGAFWADNNGKKADMDAMIMLPGYDDNGVEEIAPSENVEVRYFNLQGVEVKNPAKGSVVIRMEGNKAGKVIM